MVERPDDAHDGSDRPVPRRAVLGALGAVAGLGLAGCSSGGDGRTGPTTTGSTDAGPPPETTPTTTGTAEPTTATATATGTTTSRRSGDEYTKEAAGQAVESAVGGLAIRGWRSEIKSGATPQESLWILLTVENTGGESTELMEYSYEVTYYAEDGSVLEEGRAWQQQRSRRTVAPGETDVVQVALRNVEDPAAIAGYAVSLTCPATGSQPYC
jgi:hypothetical protein